MSAEWSNAKPLLGLVAQQAYNKHTPGKTIELNLSKGLFVVSIIHIAVVLLNPIDITSN